MKIYARTERLNDTESLIRKFAGKDVWVKMYDRSWCEDYYCKFIKVFLYEEDESHSFEMVRFNAIRARIVELDTKDGVSWQALTSLEHTRDYNEVNCSIDRGLDYFITEHSFVTPMQVLTNEELNDILNHLYEEYL